MRTSEQTIKEPEPTEADLKAAATLFDGSDYVYGPEQRQTAIEFIAIGRARARAEAEPHKNHSPCALRVLGEFYDPDEAYGIAIECTCFPMDCEQASRQAVKFLADEFERREREAAEG